MRRSTRYLLIRRILSRLLFWEWLISWSWLASLAIPVALLLRINPQVDCTDYASTLEKTVAFPALAGVCSGVGAIVAVFLPLTLQQFTSLPLAETPEEQFRRQWLVRLQEVTKKNVFASILVLMSNTVLVLIGMGKLKTMMPGMLSLERPLVYVSLAALVFGLTCFFLQLFTLGMNEAGSLDRFGNGNGHILLARIPWYHYIRAILRILLVQIFFLAALAIVVALGGSRLEEEAQEVIFDLCVIVWVPLLAATFYTLLTSRGYRNLWRDRFMRKWGAHAGLGLICNAPIGQVSTSQVKVLLNRQGQEPFRGMWLIPGGYRRWGWRSKDLDLQSTVKRRVEKLGVKTGVRVHEELASPAKVPVPDGRMEKALKWAAAAARKRLRRQPEDEGPGSRPAGLRSRIRSLLEEIVKRTDSDFTIEYSEAALRYSHAPTDTHLYLVTKEDGTPLSEADVPVGPNASLRWWSLQDIRDTREIPEHMKALLSLIFKKDKDKNDKEEKPSSLWSLTGKA